MENKFFLHRIRKDGDTFSAGIEVFHTQMEYGHGNSKFPNISFVASKITGTNGYPHKTESWTKAEE